MIAISIVLLLLLIGAIAVPSIFMKGLDPNDRYDIQRKRTLKRIRFLAPLAVAVVLVLIIGLNGIVIVDQTEVGVVRTFGQITRTLTPGMNFVNPFTDTVSEYDARV